MRHSYVFAKDFLGSVELKLHLEADIARGQPLLELDDRRGYE